MHIRRYHQPDWNDICKIHDLARLDELTSASLEDAFLPLEVAAQKESLFAYEVYVAEENGDVSGFIAFDAEEIAWLYVHPEHYKKGVGSALVRHAVALNSTPFTIEVLQGNSAALHLYKRCGFKETGTDSGKMPGNEDFLVTVHVLSNNNND